MFSQLKHPAIFVCCKNYLEETSNEHTLQENHPSVNYLSSVFRLNIDSFQIINYTYNEPKNKPMKSI